MQATPTTTEVSFSHVQLYVDEVEELASLKVLERRVNSFHQLGQGDSSSSIEESRNSWKSIAGGDDASVCTVEDLCAEFQPAGRDVVKQLIVGFGFRVIGLHENNETRSVLVSTKDCSGAKFVVTALNKSNENVASETEFRHFSAGKYGSSIAPSSTQF